MNEPLQLLLSELERFGKDHDRATTKRPLRMLNITPDTGKFLSILVRATKATRVLEIGTSNGYSTLWLAEAVRVTGGRVTTVELSEFKLGLATENFNRAGLASWIDLLHEDAGHVLAKAATGSYDLVFLDSERTEYPGWWPDIKRALRPGGVLVADNATSHPEQMAPFISMVEGDPDFTSCLVPLGNGEFLATRSSG